jgi:2-oxoisovalerate dehydrogenase E1 component
MISHLGAMLGVADGIALANKLKNEQKVVVAFSGDGGASEGDFHEAINVAAVWDLPVIFVVENNGYGLSTPSNEQFRQKQFIDKAIGYGIDGVQVNGNNILEVFDTVQNISEDLRSHPRPILLEAKTFRMRGHEEASGTKYVPQELFDEWAKKDPIANYEAYLKSIYLLDDDKIASIKKKLKKEIDADLEQVFNLPELTADIDEELADVYYPYTAEIISPTTETKSKKRLVDAISDGLRQSMEKHHNLVLMGQDIAEYGGVFKITDGFVNQFGKDRVRNTPICESAIVGAAYGLSIKGFKAMMEMQFADFVTCGFNQIINNLAKSHYRWGQNADVVIRMPTGAGVNAGPFHSQSNEAWFFHTPGLKVVYPSSPSDAKGLLCASFNDPNPILFFEHKALYRSKEEEVYDDYYTIEIGKAKTVKEGTELSIISYGAAVHWAIAECEKANIDAEIIDLRTLLPWDKDAVEATVKKTGKVLIVHEDTITGGIGAEIAAWISEFCFKHLDAPVMRVGSLDTPVPMAKNLEENFLAKKHLGEVLKKLLSY